MGVRENLVLDHFYISATPEEFEDLLTLMKVVRTGATHDNVKTDNDRWEGLYLWSRIGSVFEILRDRRPEFLGLAFQTYVPMSVDAARIVDESIPGIASPAEWRKSSRSMADGQPWFDSFSLSKEETTRETLFDAWIMKYHLRHRAEPTVIQPRAVDRFNSIQFSLGREHVEELQQKSRFFPPGSTRFTSDTVIFEIADRDGYKFIINIRLVDGSQRFVFEEISFDMYERAAIPDFSQVEMQLFTLARQGRKIVLKRK